MTIERMQNDRDLTLNVMNQQFNKNLDPILPHLFKPSSLTSFENRTAYYDNILECVLQHITARDDTSIDLFGAIRLLVRVTEVEPNCDKRTAATLYDELSHRLM